MRLSYPSSRRTSATLPTCTPAQEWAVYDGTNWCIAVMRSVRAGCHHGEGGRPEQPGVEELDVGVDGGRTRGVVGHGGERFVDGAVPHVDGPEPAGLEERHP